MDRTETLTVSGSTVEFGASDAENLPYAQLADFSAFLISVAPALDMLNISGDLFRRVVWCSSVLRVGLRRVAVVAVLYGLTGVNTCAGVIQEQL